LLRFAYAKHKCPESISLFRLINLPAFLCYRIARSIRWDKGSSR